MQVGTRLLQKGLGYIAIRQFPGDVVAGLESALRSLEKVGLQRLILDLRGNPGGVYPQAQQVAGKFLSSGTPISYTKGHGAVQSNMSYSSDSSPRSNLPLVIIVDRATAAGAELVAGSLQETGRCLLVGTPTSGSATIQTALPLSGDSLLRLTTARWFTPKGRSVENIGLRPDILMESTLSADAEMWGVLAQDRFLQRAVEVVHGQRQ
jgi:carboxyl-terminal processing protease